MKRWLLGSSVVAAMLFAASSAFAGGVNLQWSRCFGEGLGTANRTFACASNGGVNQLVTSFVLDTAVPTVSGNELVLDFISSTNPLPAWWEMKDLGTCRQNAVNFSTSANPLDGTCVDWAQGQSAGGIGSYDNSLGSIDPSFTAQHRRMKVALAVQLTALQDLAAGTEYFSCNININNAKTVGPVNCAGCTDQVCIVLNSIRVTTNTPGGAADVTLGTPTVAGSNEVTWQGAGANCAAVPVRNATWGQVKALYR